MVCVGWSQTEISKMRDKVLGRKIQKRDSTDLLLDHFGFKTAGYLTAMMRR